MGFLDDVNKWLPALSFGSGFLTNRAQKQSATTGPVVSPADAALRGQIVDKTKSYLNSAPTVENYLAPQESGINHNADLERENTMARLAAAGIGPDSPAYEAALNHLDSTRFGAINNLRQNAPLAMANTQGQVLQAANGVFNSAPRTVASNSTVAGNPFGGGFSSMAETLAYLAGRGAFGKKPIPGASNTNIPPVNNPIGPYAPPRGMTSQQDVLSKIPGLLF